jgi:hypothetical protein
MQRKAIAMGNVALDELGRVTLRQILPKRLNPRC